MFIAACIIVNVCAHIVRDLCCPYVANKMTNDDGDERQGQINEKHGRSVLLRLLACWLMMIEMKRLKEPWVRHLVPQRQVGRLDGGRRIQLPFAFADSKSPFCD